MKHLSQTWPLQAGRRNWLIAAGILIATLALISLIDVEVMHLARNLPPEVVSVFGWITRLGESDWVLIPTLVGLPIAAIAAVLARKGVVKRAMWELAGVCGFVFAGVGLPGLFTAIFKRIVGRPRPEVMDAYGAFDLRTMSWLEWTHQSFPSGHATTGFAFCFVVAFLFPRSYPWMLVFAGLISISRIVVGVHYSTDIVAGAVIGLMGAYLVRNVFAWRGWLFHREADGTVTRMPFEGMRALFGR